jgi:hypothetical protein
MALDKVPLVPFTTEYVVKMRGVNAIAVHTRRMIVEDSLIKFQPVIIAGIPATDKPSFRIPGQNFFLDYRVLPLTHALLIPPMYMVPSPDGAPDAGTIGAAVMLGPPGKAWLTAFC